MDGKNDIENVKRPQDGKIGSQDDFPFRAQQTSKAESFSALQEQIERAAQIDDRAIADFLAKIEGKSTTREELAQAAAVAQQLAERPGILSPEAQSQLLDVPRAIANHRNADYSLQEESKNILLKAATAMPALSDEAQKKLIDRATLLAASNRDPQWRFEFLENIADSGAEGAIAGGLDGIADIAKDSLVNFLGKTADKFASMGAKDQARFQKAAVKAVKMMQGTQFPYKFDADALREALFAVPESMRSEEYKTQLAALERNSAAEKNPAPEVPVAIVVPEEDLNVEPEVEPQPKNTAEDYDQQLGALERNSAAEKNPAPEVPVAIVVPEEELNVEPEVEPQPKNTAEDYDQQLAASERNLAAEKNPAPEVPVAIVVPEEDLNIEPEPEVEPQPENFSEIPPPQSNPPLEGQLPFLILENARPKSPTSQAEKLEEDAANQENILTAKAE
jgi:hypothetical protein